MKAGKFQLTHISDGSESADSGDYPDWKLHQAKHLYICYNQFMFHHASPSVQW